MTTVTKTPTYAEVKAALVIVARNDPDTASDMTQALNRSTEETYPDIAREVIEISQEWLETEQQEAAAAKAEPKARFTSPAAATPVQRRGAYAPPKTHLWTADQLASKEPLLYRFIAAGLWLFSLTGTLLAFVGGYDLVTFNPLAWDAGMWISLGVGLGWQIAVSIVQLVTCRSVRNPVYWLALAASVIPAFIGYRPIILVPLTAWVSGNTGDVFASISSLRMATGHAIVWALGVHAAGIIAFTASDIVPERIFVKH